MNINIATRSLFLFIICLSFLCCVNNKKIIQTWTNKPPNPEMYYSYVFKAEQAIVDGQLTNAVLYYDSAFVIMKPFQRDIQNALVSALENNADSTIVLQILELGNNLMRNTNIIDYYMGKSINNSPSFPYRFIRKNLSNKEYLPWLTNKLPKNQVPPPDSITLNLLELLIGKDQKPRDSCSLIYNDFYNQQDCRNVIMNVDILNQDALLKLLNSKKINYKNRTIVNEQILEVIALHNGAWGRMDLHRKYKELVHDGVIDARMYAGLFDRLFDTKENKYIDTLNLFTRYGETTRIISSDYLFIYKYSEEKRRKINSYREEIYLDSYLGSELRYIWQVKHPQYYFKTNYVFNSPGFLNDQLSYTKNNSLYIIIHPISLVK